MSRYALPLRGYDRASLWGYDSQDMSYFAQLWRNESDSWNDPDIWINWFTLQKPVDARALAELISARTGQSPSGVLRAMAAAKDAPESAALLELAEFLAAPGVV
jgi:hypothetical protein